VDDIAWKWLQQTEKSSRGSCVTCPLGQFDIRLLQNVSFHDTIHAQYDDHGCKSCENQLRCGAGNVKVLMLSPSELLMC
jgi:hypothetical protein